MFEKYQLNFNESAIFGEKAHTHRGGRIEIYPLHNGKIDLYDKEEITVILPNEMWIAIREKLDGVKF